MTIAVYPPETSRKPSSGHQSALSARVFPRAPRTAEELDTRATEAEQQKSREGRAACRHDEQASELEEELYGGDNEADPSGSRAGESSAKGLRRERYARVVAA